VIRYTVYHLDVDIICLFRVHKHLYDVIIRHTKEDVCTRVITSGRLGEAIEEATE